MLCFLLQIIFHYFTVYFSILSFLPKFINLEQCSEKTVHEDQLLTYRYCCYYVDNFVITYISCSGVGVSFSICHQSL